MEKAQTGWKILTLITIYLTNQVLKMGLGNLYLFKVHLLFHNIASSGNLMFYYFSESLFSFKVGLFFWNQIIKCMQTKRYRRSLVILIWVLFFYHLFSWWRKERLTQRSWPQRQMRDFWTIRAKMGKARRRRGPQTNGAILGSVSDDRGHAMYPTPALEVGEQFIQLYHTHGYFCDYLIFAFMLKKIRKNLVYCLSL